MKNAIANTVSALLHPILVPLYGMFLYYFYDTTLAMPQLFKLVAVSLVAVFMVLLPVLWYFLLYKTGVLSGVSAKERKDRYWLYAFTLVCYLVTVGALFFLRNLGVPVDSAILRVLIGACCSLGTVFIVNFFWKISAHATAIGGLTGAAIFITQSYGENLWWVYCILLLLSALVVQSRLQLNAHNPGQLAAGYVTGLFFCYFFPLIYSTTIFLL